MKKFNRYLTKIKEDSIRDFTGLGNPFLITVLAALFIGINFLFLKIFLGIIMIEIVAATIKFFFYKKRPHKEEHANFLEKIDAGSFPSIHSARAIFVFAIISMHLPIFGKVFTGVLVLMVGITRILLKKHDVVDIMGGYLLGALVFILMVCIW